ncbi:MAG: hypothetical protein HYZ75_00435 [Elusimicrobia bacterium]|nr:hypothetical protein [Elusimicrobiota bacterium]
MADKNDPLGLKKDKRRNKEDEGGAATLPGGAAASLPQSAAFDSGAAALSTIGRAAPTSGAHLSVWESMVSAVGQATGLGPAAAAKASLVAMVVGASSVAAGISVYIGNSGGDSSMRLGGRVFVNASQDETPGLTLKPAPVRREPEPDAATGASLDFLSQANGPAPEKEAAAPAAAKTDWASAIKQADAPATKDAPAAAAETAPKQAVPRPEFTKRAISERGDPGGKVTLKAVDSITGGVGSGFQEVYRPPRTGSFDAMARKSQSRTMTRKIAMNSSGANAMDQARFTNRMSRSGQRMGLGATSAHTASLPFDGGNAAAALPPQRAAGTSTGGAGIGSTANSILDSRSVTPPPAPDADKKGENKTPYQGLVMAATAALMAGTVLLMLAGKLASDPAQKATAQGVAMAAMAAGGAAAAIGGVVSGQYDQLTQGMPFIMGGGILAAQAGMVIAKAEKAAQEGAQGVQGAGADAAGAAGQALQSAMGPAMQAMQGQQGEGEEPEPDKPATPTAQGPRTVAKPPTYTGNINVEGL